MKNIKQLKILIVEDVIEDADVLAFVDLNRHLEEKVLDNAPGLDETRKKLVLNVWPMIKVPIYISVEDT
jgi:hypothetical protein